MTEIREGDGNRELRRLTSVTPIDVIVRGLLFAFHKTLRGRKLAPRADVPARVMLTGSFYSEKWIRTHLVPIARCGRVEEVVFVGTTSLQGIPGVRFVQAPAWLTRLLGQSLARLVMFGASAIRDRPDYLGGFHLQVNGMVAIWLARLLRRRSIYISTGGPIELVDGGIKAENALFKRMSRNYPQVESGLVHAAGAADLIVAKGRSAQGWFAARCSEPLVAVIPGGFPMTAVTDREKIFDLISVARISPLKRIDRLLTALSILNERNLPLKLVIVGDGPDRAEMEQLTETLGLGHLVTFAGWQSDVDTWLAQSRLFVLTSDSEGLSQAVVQALIQGVPVVSADVGDLGDVVQPGVNGELVTPLTPEAFADVIQALITDPAKLERYAANARTSVEHLSMEEMAHQWDELIRALDRRTP